MGFLGWLFDSGSKEHINSKTEKTSTGRREHFLVSNKGNKKNHSHVVVNYNKKNRITSAHGNGPKNKRS
jgi:hypothetical protein